LSSENAFTSYVFERSKCNANGSPRWPCSGRPFSLVSLRWPPSHFGSTSRRVLIKAHLAEGNVIEAIREYGTYRRLLVDELGVDPSPHMLALLEQSKSSAVGGWGSE
jgi:Bacterial transcriptional activator domain